FWRLGRGARANSTARTPLTRHHPSRSGNRLLDELANLGFRRSVQRGDVPHDGVHVDTLLTCGVQGFTKAERDEVLARFDVADVLAVIHIEREPPAYDRFQRRRVLPYESVETLANLPVLRGGFTEFGEDGRIALLREHVFRPP